jgi:hypothetical protein
MKRSTLILLLAAVGFGVIVYFLEIRDGKPRDEESSVETSKPAFEFKREDIASITLTRAGQTITIEDRDGKWVLTQPENAAADESAINSLASSLTSARIERTFSASPEDMKSYGLEEPKVTLEVKLKSGEQHRVKLGEQDVSKLSAYAQIGDSSEVVLVGSSLLTNADKPLNELRDRSVFGAAQFDVSSVAINNEHGRIELGKKDTDWILKSAGDAPADDSEVNSLLSEVTSAKADEFASDKSEELAKYGLDKPNITLTAKLNDGSERVLKIGLKDDEYYAKNSARSEILKVPSSLFDKLNVKPASLRDKQIMKFKEDELSRVEIRNPNGKLVVERNDEGKWLIKEPADKKDKEAQRFKIVDPLETKAEEIVEKPSGTVRAKLAKSKVEVRVTGKDGKTTVLTVSEADGDDVYVIVKGRPEVFKVRKQMLEDLSFKMADVVI